MKKINLQWLYILLVLLPFGLWSCEEENEPDQNKEFEREVEVNNETTKGKIVINESYVPIDWEKSTSKVISGNDKSGHFELQMDKSAAEQIRRGSLITIDVDSGILLRKVTSCKREGDKVIIESMVGSLAELIGDSEFEIILGDTSAISFDNTKNFEDIPVYNPEDEEGDEYDPNEAPQAPVTRAEVKKDLPKLYPSEVRYKDENGKWVKRKLDATTRGTSEYTLINWSIEKSFRWDPIGDDIDEVSKHSDKRSSIKKSGGLEFTLGAGFSAAGSLEVKGLEGLNKVGITDVYDAYDEGRLKVTPMLTTKLTIDANLAAFLEVSKTFEPEEPYEIIPQINLAHIMVPIVPPLMLDITPAVGVDFNPSLTISGKAEFGAHAHVEIPEKVGFTYDSKKSGRQAFSNKSKKAHIEVTYPDAPYAALTGSADLGLEFDPWFALLVYGLVGPKIVIGPDLHVKAAGAVSTDAVSRKISADIGLFLKLGFDYKADEIMTDPIPISPAVSLFSSPSDLVCETDEDKVLVGDENELEFVVYDNLFGVSYPTKVPFSLFNDNIYLKASDGDVLIPVSYHDYEQSSTNKLMVETKDGRAKVKWKPSDKSSTLDVRMYQPPSNILTNMTLKPNNSPDGLKAIDLGTSVLWASYNVGAKNEGEIGGLYGWGDAYGMYLYQGAEDSEKYGGYKSDWQRYYGGKKPKKNISGTEYDIARTEWGGAWRMPTVDEWYELITKCDWNLNSPSFAEVKGNGNTMLLPCAGARIGTNYMTYDKLWPSWDYWSANIDGKDKDNANYMFFVFDDKSHHKPQIGSSPRYYGQSVRPVKDKKK